jgi:drug/metabolite transporter (DMT)-like permease
MEGPRHEPPLLAWIGLLVLYVVWGSTYLAIRIVVHEMPPFAAAALRFLTAGVLMGAVALVIDRDQGWPTLRQWRDYAFAGALFLGGGNAGVMWAETRVSSGLAALLVATVPLWITLLDGLRAGGQRWTRSSWTAVLVGFAGVALVVRPDGSGNTDWAGVGALQLGALSWTLAALYLQTVRAKLRTASASAIEMLAGAAVLSVEAWVAGEDVSRFATASSSAWLGLLYLMIFGSLVGFTTFSYCLNELPAATVGTYAYVNPIVAVILGRVFLNEPLSWSMGLGALLIVAGVFVTTYVPRRDSASEA